MFGIMGGGTHAARGERIHRTVCVLHRPGLPCAELLEPAAKQSLVATGARRQAQAYQPSLSQALLARASCGCTTSESVRLYFCVMLDSGATSPPCPPFTWCRGLLCTAQVCHAAIAFGCSQLLVGTRLLSAGVWQLQECLLDSLSDPFLRSPFVVRHLIEQLHKPKGVRKSSAQGRTEMPVVSL